MVTKEPQWRCHVCGYESSTWEGKNGAQTHADEKGHVRIDLILRPAKGKR